MKNKKLFLGIGIGILTAIILLVIVFLITNFSRNKAIKLVEKSLNCKNFTVQATSSNKNLTMQYKDNVYMIKSILKDEKSENENTYFAYEDLNKDEIIFGDDNYALISSISKYKNEENSQFLESYSLTALNNLKSEDYDYTFINSTKYNNEKCYIICLQLKDKNKVTKDKPFKVVYTISKQNGFVLKSEEYNSNDTLSNTTYYTVTLDNVNDADVQRPDLDSFKSTQNI